MTSHSDGAGGGLCRPHCNWAFLSALDTDRMHIIYTNMHFWNYSKDMWWLICYKIYFQEKELLLNDTARSKWYHLSMQREITIVTNQLSAVLHTYIHTVLFKLILRKIRQFSNYIKKIRLYCKTAVQAWRRSCSAGWSHRLVQLLHCAGLKLEYRNKGVDHHTPAKKCWFRKHWWVNKIQPFNSFMTQFLRQKDDPFISYNYKIKKNLIILQNSNISSFKHNSIFSKLRCLNFYIFSDFDFFQNYAIFSNS